MGVMYLGFSDASGITVARGASPSLVGMPEYKTDCIHDNIPCAAQSCAALDYVRVAHNSATSPRADDPAIIGRRSGHASYGLALRAPLITWEVAV
jgi:hypothetical protein